MNRAQRRAQKSKKTGANYRINPRTQKGVMGTIAMHRPSTRSAVEDLKIDK